MAAHPRRDRASDRRPPDNVQDILRRHTTSANATRRGICLLNAGQPEQAIRLFESALEVGGDGRSLPALMSACLRAMGGTDSAVKQAQKAVDVTDPSPSARTSASIRLALTLFESGHPNEAKSALREAIRNTPEDGELHFQLGMLLASLGEMEEAELRFTQTVSIDRNHSEARVNLALCCGARHAPGEAVGHLQVALSRRPLDARIAMLLAQATGAARQSGRVVNVRATIPQEDWLADREGIEELSRVIEGEPDFVDAFIAIPTGEVDRQVFAVLLSTLEQALERQPEQAELHYHCGRVLARLGRADDAISASEAAVELNPKYTRALIDLAKLYCQTDRRDDATIRLEQAVACGADHVDVHYLLGNLYRDQGRLGLARRAYRRALSINHGFAPAQKALAELLC